MDLSSKQKKFLKQQAHNLDPIVFIGKKGVTPAVLAELEGTLEANELVKIKVHADERESYLNALKTVSRRTGAELVQSIGRTGTLYRPSNDEKKARISRLLPRP